MLSTPVQAEPMSGAEFDAYTKGKTLYFGRGGAPYGAEVYLDNRRLRWSFLDGECKDGYWYEEAPSSICFVYEDRPEPQCWSFENGRHRPDCEVQKQSSISGSLRGRRRR